MRLLVRYAFMLNCICLIDWVRLNLNSPNLNSNECVGIVFKNGKPFLSSPLSIVWDPSVIPDLRGLGLSPSPGGARAAAASAWPACQGALPRPIKGAAPCP